MSIDELERRIVEVKKRGLNIIVETELIATLRGDYYEKLISKKQRAITDLFKQNIFYLSSLHNQLATSNALLENMGVTVDKNFNKIIYSDYLLYSIRTAIVVSEFYGLPVEYLLFTDLKANAETLKTFYPALFRQGRD